MGDIQAMAAIQDLLRSMRQILLLRLRAAMMPTPSWATGAIKRTVIIPEI
jgi:hypothetical protein